MDSDLRQKWNDLLSEFGWKYHEIKGLPIYSNQANGKVYFSTFPDISYGIHPCALPRVDAEVIHAILKEYSNNIYIGDILGGWRHVEYQSKTINYQVIKEFKPNDNCARNIEKAKENCIKVRQMETAKEFQKCIEDTAMRHGKAHFNLWTLEAVLRNFGGLIATYKGIPIAGCIYAEEGDKIRFLNSASRTDFMELGGSYAVMDYLIQQVAKGREIWLGNAPEALLGLRRWKEGFGAEMRTFDVLCYEK